MSRSSRSQVLVGTADGLHEWGAHERSQLVGREITALAREGGTWWAIVENQTLWRSRRDGSWGEVAGLADPQVTCLSPTASGLLVGTAGAHLFRLDEAKLVPVESFEEVEGRSTWYTPWGEPPDTRSISDGPAGTIYVNVHVGGVVRSTDRGRSWRPTLDIHADVHQVLAHPEMPGLVFVAAAVGLGISDDAGDSWRFETEHLHGVYMRAVTLAGDTILVSASTGPRGRHAALYWRRFARDEPFERCRQGLPEWFRGNIDTYCLAASGPVVVVGTHDGVVFHSMDQGRSWEMLAKGLPPIQCVAIG